MFRRLSAIGAALFVVISAASGVAPREIAAPVDRAVVVTQLDASLWVTPHSAGGAFVIPGFALSASERVDLALERFRVATSATHFVVGHEQRPLRYDPESVVLLRGGIVGRPGSHVFLAIAPSATQGYIDTGDGRKLGVSSRVSAGLSLSPGQVAVFPQSRAGNPLPPGVPLCGLSDIDVGSAIPAPSFPPLYGVAVSPRIKQIELAVETDYEYFSLFGNLDDAGDYVVALYGAVSDIYLRDVNARVVLSYVRLWDNPADLFNEPDPLTAFRDFWNNNMAAVNRDAAQLCSGRRNLPAGGVAWVGALCGSFGYSWTGYVLGFFDDPSVASIYNRDIMVAAHELGHNCNSPHTQDLGLDTCHIETSPPQRGTIMSYCGQTFTGGDANMDMRFGSVVESIIQSYLSTAPCVVDDCNGNGIDDAADIAGATSADADGDGIPDECQDCNHNNVLDSIDIIAASSLDLNGNLVPDECEQDCNGNAIPDDLDFQSGGTVIAFSDNFEGDLGWSVTSSAGLTDGAWQRGIPVNDPGSPYDPATDADGSGRCYLTANRTGNSDVDDGSTTLTSPLIDMSAGGFSVRYSYYLRLTNQNGADMLLVEGNDAGGAGTWREIARHTTDGGTSWRSNVITAGMIASAGLNQTATMRFRFTANDANPQSIVEAGVDGFDVFFIAPPLSADLNLNNLPDECEPDCDNNGVLDVVQINANMALDLNRNSLLDSCEDCDGDSVTDLVELNHSHNVWVADTGLPRVREYLALYGTFTAQSADAALSEPQDLIVTADRRILVSSRNDHRVVEFNLSGAFVRNLVASGAGGLSRPAALAISPAGTLLVVSNGSNQVLEYDAGTGAFLRVFAAHAALAAPFGLAFRPGGNLFVTTSGNQVLEFDRGSGAFVRVFVSSAANGGLSDPHGMLFIPNGNLLVCSTGSNQVLEYDGASGAFVRQFSQVGTATVMTLDQPWCLRLGPDGGVYCSRNFTAGADHEHEGGMHHSTSFLHLTNARIYHFNATSGWFVRAFIMGVDSGVTHASGFDFVPDAGTDCNNNQIPDNCDIAAGRSADADHDGVPDECRPACIGDTDGDRDIDLSDLARLLANFGTSSGATRAQGDTDGDGDVDLTDLARLLANFGSVCG